MQSSAQQYSIVCAEVPRSGCNTNLLETLALIAVHVQHAQMRIALIVNSPAVDVQEAT